MTSASQPDLLWSQVRSIWVSYARNLTLPVQRQTSQLEDLIDFLKRLQRYYFFKYTCMI